MSSPWIELLHLRYSSQQAASSPEPPEFLQGVPELFSDVDADNSEPGEDTPQ